MTEEQIKKMQEANDRINEAWKAMRDAKPNDRSEMDRRYAIAITELEKVAAYFNYYIVQG